MKSVVGSMLSQLYNLRWRRGDSRFERDLSLTQAGTLFSDPRDRYRYMHHWFHRHAPIAIKQHRNYFRKEKRGFGEDAFHAMWWKLFEEFRPTAALEIGVYRGQTVSLWGVICKTLGFQCEIHAISPFSPAADAVSRYSQSIDYKLDVLDAFRRWQLPAPTLVQALSTEPVATVHMQSRTWDLIYIDGSHDYDVVKSDYLLAVSVLKPGGLLVLDDAGLGSNYQPPRFAFAGHPGPSRVARELADRQLEPLGMVGHNNIYRIPLNRSGGRQ